MKKLLGLPFFVNNRGIIAQVYQYLLVLFVIAGLLTSLGILEQGSINLLFLAVVLGLVGVFLSPEIEAKSKLSTYWLIVPLFLALGTRVIPYLNNKIPLGYDAGMYKFAFEHPGFESLKELYSRLYITVMGGLSDLFGSYFLLVPLHILVTSLTVLVVYFVVKRLFSPEVGVLAAFLFALSGTQYDVFSFCFQKNALGLILLLVSFLYFEKASTINWQLILVGVLIGSVHRPAFLLFGLVYIAYVVVHLKAFDDAGVKNAIVNGALILVITLLVNWDRIVEYYFFGAFTFIDSIGPAEAEGGFYYSLSEYLYRSPIMIAFVLPGIVYAPRKSLPVLIAGILLGLTIVFRLWFFRRFIIYLDLVIIIYAAAGLSDLMRDSFINRRIPLGVLLCVVILFSLGIQLANLATETGPMISQEEFDAVLAIDDLVEPEAMVVLTDAYYAPWLRGWSETDLVAPGLFESDVLSYQQWEFIWYGDTEERLAIFRTFQPPLYIHQGTRTENLIPFDEVCFQPIEVTGTRLYRFDCWE